MADRPAFLTSYDGHTGWANSRALKLAGITRRTPNPANGIIVKDPRTGEPTGVLKEAAMALVSSLVPKPTRDEQIAALRAAITEAHRRGVTSVQNASGTADELGIYDELRRATGTRSPRLCGACRRIRRRPPSELDAFDELKTKYSDDPVFKAGAIKLIADGVIESNTAAMLQPYTNRPATSGEPRFDQPSLDRLVKDLDRRGWQVMIHAIGDRAIRMALTPSKSRRPTIHRPPRGRRHRIEHIETIDPADIPRFGPLGVIASMQPYHSLPDLGGVWSQNIGPERVGRAWLYGSIAKAQGRLAFGSDWPVVSMDPLLGLFVAVNRTTLDGEPDGGWIPSERLSLQTGDRRLHSRRRLGVVRRAPEGLARARHARRHRGPVAGHLFAPAGPARRDRSRGHDFRRHASCIAAARRPTTDKPGGPVWPPNQHGASFV